MKRPFLRWLFGARADVAHRRRTAFLHGMQVMLPAVSATLVWGLVTGVAMVKTASRRTWPPACRSRFSPAARNWRRCR